MEHAKREGRRARCPEILAVEDAKLAAWRAVGNCDVYPPNYFRKPDVAAGGGDTSAAAAPAPKVGLPLPTDPAGLVRLLDHPYLTVQLRARRALAELGGRAVGDLQVALSSRYACARRHALAALRDVGAEAAPARGAAEARLDDEDPGVRVAACEVLFSIGKPSKAVVERLARIIVGYSGDGRAAALLRRWLRGGGPEAKAVAAWLGEMEPKAKALVHELGRAGPEADLTFLLSRARGNLAGEIGWFRLLIEKSNLPANQVVPAVHDALRREGATGDAWYVASLAALVSRYGPATAGAAPSLTAALEHPAEHARRCVAKALGDVGPAAAGALPALRRLAKEDAGLGVRQGAAEAIARIEAKPN